jgi:hypothetical protein
MKIRKNSRQPKQKSPDCSGLTVSGLGCRAIVRPKFLPPIVLQLANALSIGTPLRDFYHGAVSAWQDTAVIPQLAKQPTASFPVAHVFPPGKKFL